LKVPLSSVLAWTKKWQRAALNVKQKSKWDAENLRQPKLITTLTPVVQSRVKSQGLFLHEKHPSTVVLLHLTRVLIGLVGILNEERSF
jgi:hypothetical protein